MNNGLDRNMSASVIKTLVKWAGITMCALCGAYLSGYSATYGAMLTGLREGGWNWQFAPFLFGGWVGGLLFALIAVTVCAILRCSSSTLFVVPLLLPPLIAGVIGAVAFPILVQSEKIQSKQFQEKTQATKTKYDGFYQVLKNNPETGLREKWYLIDYDSRSGVFNVSLADPEVPYTLEQMKRLYVEAPSTRNRLFAHPACDAAFLSQHFQEAYDQAISINYGMLAAIVSNPNTPKELIEKVANSHALPMGAVGPAKNALKKRGIPRKTTDGM